MALDFVLPAGGARCRGRHLAGKQHGVTLSNRGVAMSSNPLSPSEGVSGLMGLVVWNYRLIGPTPAGLRVRLCSQTRCTEIDGENGTTQAFNGVPAIEPLRLSGKCRAGDV
jgi:hypothetical protein